MLAVDGRVAFITGLCIGRAWEGIPEKGREPWRDTGIGLRGPAVRDVEAAFAGVWAMAGPPLPAGAPEDPAVPGRAGEVSLRVVATVPVTSGMLRLDLLMAALARRRIWLSDAYYAGVSAYVQALRSAARDGVDVRLLVPGASDLPLVKTLTRAGYRALLEAGVRVFEWNGSMLHAKTAVVDGRWTRVGSTNLNISSWLGNCELDAVIEDEEFARTMEETYQRDLEHATEIVLGPRRRVCAPDGAGCERRVARGGGSVGRTAAGAIRIGNAIGAAFADRRVLETIESRTMMLGGLLLLALSAGVALLPRLVAWPLAAVGAWIALTLLVRGLRLSRRPKKPDDVAGRNGS
jgi:cardiolipin synthase